MENLKLFQIGGIFVLIHFTINIVLTKDILDWVPSLQKRILMIAFVWCFPLLGALFTYKDLNLAWFKKVDKKSAGNASISGGLLGIDSFVNPGAKYLAELMQKEQVEESEQGELFDKKFVDAEIKSLKNND